MSPNCFRFGALPARQHQGNVHGHHSKMENNKAGHVRFETICHQGKEQGHSESNGAFVTNQSERDRDVQVSIQHDPASHSTQRWRATDESEWKRLSHRFQKVQQMVYFRTGLHVCITPIEEIGQYSYERLSDLFFLDAEHSEHLDWQYSHEDDAHTLRTQQSQGGLRGRFRSVCGDAPISLTQPQPTTEHTTVDPPRKTTTYATRRHDRNRDANTTMTAH